MTDWTPKAREIAHCRAIADNVLCFVKPEWADLHKPDCDTITKAITAALDAAERTALQRAAEASYSLVRSGDTPWDHGYNVGVQEAEAAIRALIPKETA